MSAPDNVRGTDRGMWRVVAARDFRVRLKDRGFVISTAITLVVLSIFILLRAFAGDDAPSFHLGLVGEGSRSIGSQIERQAPESGVKVETRVYVEPAAADRALAAGEIDAELVDGRTLVGQSDVDDRLDQVVQGAAVGQRIREALVSADLSPSEIEELFSDSAVVVRTIEPADPNRDANAGVAFIAVLLVYGQLFGYGVWIATGVIEEKASRVVEILLSAIRPHQLLGGKIVGIGLLGIGQLVFIAGFAIGLALLTGALRFPGSAIVTAGVVLVWFVLGFAFYAGLFAVSGSLVSRTEELQNAMVPINLTIFVSFFISIGALENPDSTLAIVASILPFSSALAMPVRIALGAATAIQIVASIVALLAGTALLVPLSARVYAGAVLRTGAKVKLKDAWRAAG
ncbi:MAG TPA: ABC transporter permease [Actinomycetota bacterium]